jgi:hypothetical protein
MNGPAGVPVTVAMDCVGIKGVNCCAKTFRDNDGKKFTNPAKEPVIINAAKTFRIDFSCDLTIFISFRL